MVSKVGDSFKAGFRKSSHSFDLVLIRKRIRGFYHVNTYFLAMLIVDIVL